jgi:hypothetical protein
MLMFNEELRLEAKKELGGRDLDGDSLESNAEIDEDEVGDGEDKRGYDRLYQWEMLLGDEPLFEYLGPEGQSEQEPSANFIILFNCVFKAIGKLLDLMESLSNW